MKIFPSTHKIKSVTDSHVDLDLNIPLAYIELDFSKYNIDNIVESKFANDSKEEVLINQRFESPNIKLFNKYNEAVDMNNLLTRVGEYYYYRPKEMISFKPQYFNYNATIKTKLNYKIANTYNVNIACVDDPDSLDLSQRVASGFSNPSSRNITPPNIIINDNRIDAQAFSDIDLENCDILFIESPDGKYYDDSINPILIDKETFFNSNTAIWLASEFNTTYPHENASSGLEFSIKNPILNTKTSINCNTYFNINSLPYNPNVIYHNIFNEDNPPVIIIEHIGRSYEIISSIEIIKDIPNNIQLIYECILFCYLNRYKKTDTLTQWISSDVPDYQIEAGKLVKKQYFMSDIDIYKYFNLKSTEVNLYEVNITDSDLNEFTKSKTEDLYDSSSTVHFIGMSGGKLLFDKTLTRSSAYNLEPEKPIGWVSIYNGDSIVYLPELHYTIETNLNNKVFYNTNEESLEVKILAFKSSSLGIDTQIPVNKVISFIKTEVNKIEKIRKANYLFYINLNNMVIDYVFEEDFEDSMGEKLFTIRVYQTNEAVNITDMRQLGGGLVEDEEDNYNLMDIGHINGRPYRETGTLIFTLPTKYKDYEETILKAIKKYIDANDMPVILFEDKEQ